MKYILFLMLLFGLGLGNTYSQTSQCFSCAKVIYIVDNSGSVSGTEFNDMKNSIDQVSASLFANYTNLEIAVVQYKHDGGNTPQYDVTVPFTSNVGTAQTWGRMTSAGVQDHLPGSLNVMRNNGLWGAGGQLDLTSDGCEIRFFVFTDAGRESMWGCCSDLFNGGSNAGSVPAGTLNGFGEYDFLKMTYGAVFTVYHIPPDNAAQAAGAAISSVGGNYNGVIDPNPTDPDGSGVLPRKYEFGNSFALTPAQINDIVLNINPTGGGISFQVSDSLSLDVSDSLCVGTPAVFTSVGDTASYTEVFWDFGDGNVDSSNISPVHTYAAAGTYTVTHIVAIDTCRDTATRVVDVFAYPIANFTIDSVCAGITNTINNLSTGPYNDINWDFGDGTTGTNTANTFTHTYAVVGSYTTKLVLDNYGCKDSTTRVALVEDAPRPNFTFTNPCQYEDVMITNVSTSADGTPYQNFTWDWDLGNGVTSTVTDPTTSYPAHGVFDIWLEATTSNGCVKDTTIQITVHPKPQAGFSSDSVCVGLITQITDTSSVPTGTINSWEYTTDGVSYSVQNPMHQYGTDGQFGVTQIVTSNFGCKDTVTNNAVVHPLPVPDFNYSPEELDVFQSTTCFTNLSAGAVSYYWDFDFDNHTSTSVDPCETFPKISETYYDVKLIATTNYGCIDSITKTLRVKGVFLIYVPNAFTPDGDGKNDVFLPQYTAVGELEFYVFNRWGDLIFETTDPTEGWDGTHQGEKSKEDAYVYRIFATDIYGIKHEKIGHVNLLR